MRWCHLFRVMRVKPYSLSLVEVHRVSDMPTEPTTNDT
ncbi:MAG: hypothetical protein V7645_2767 [Actinomycetota bacterium]|jgi:hypothetical protein